MAVAIVGRSLATQSFRQCCRTAHRVAPRQALFKPAARSFSARASVLEKKFTQEHEWVELSEDGKLGIIGISEYAAKALGDVVYVELPGADMNVTQGDSIGAVESVKSASDIMTPVSGKVVETNGSLEETPGIINKSPEQDGWLAKIELSDKAELDSLMDAQGYKAFTEDADSK